MCTSPRIIQNRTKVYYKNLTPRYLLVPCGDCEDCRKAHRNEWMVRLHFEAERYINSGGCVGFVTLTYAPKNLPRHEFMNYDTGQMDSMTCFDKSHKDLFMMRLRKLFERDGLKVKRCVNGQYNMYNSELGVKFMFAGENGSGREYEDDNGRIRKAQYQPHFHILLFFPRWVKENYDEIELKNIVASCWSVPGSDLDKYRIRVVYPGKHYYHFNKNALGHWSLPCLLGHVDFSIDKITGEEKFFVNSDYALDYASKYCVKDPYQLNKPSIKRYLRSCEHDCVDPDRSLLPGHYQSQNLGSTILDLLERDSQVLVKGIDLNESSDRKELSVLASIQRQSVVKYPVPRIFADKFQYNKIPIGKNYDGSIYYVNEYRPEILQMRLDSLNDKIQSQVDGIKSFFWSEKLRKYLDHADLSTLKISDITSKELFYKKVQKFFKNTDLFEFCHYVINCQGLTVHRKLFNYLASLDKNDLHEEIKWYHIHRRWNVSSPDFTQLALKDISVFEDENFKPVADRFIPLASLPQFKGYQSFLQFYNLVKGWYMRAGRVKYEKDNELKKAQNREFYKINKKRIWYERTPFRSVP